MLVVLHFAVPEPDTASFLASAWDALEALAGCPGFRSGRAGRAADDAAAWVLVTEWDGVGAYRRALSAYDVKVRATPLLARARDEPGAFEVLLTQGTGTQSTAVSDRADDADTSGPGRRPEAGRTARGLQSGQESS